MSKLISIDILVDGTIRFTRMDPETNKEIFEIISDIAPEQAEEVRQFLEGANEIKPILGEESLCG